MLNQEFLFKGYRPAEAGYDEVFASDGSVRQHWLTVVESLTEELEHEGLRRRWLIARDDLNEMGFEEPQDAGPGGGTRCLDFLPHLITNQEWSELAAGLQQRAELLDLLLRDLYGPQRCLHEGLLPAEWLFSHPGFHRVHHNSQPPGKTHLHFYAADLVRTQDGAWCIVADHTDTPAGLGLALENRVAVSRLLPNLMANHNVERFAPFFEAVDQTLHRLATGANQPRIVLLSRGPTDPNYVEQTYLARYLGYTLVEGGDLTVRDDRVFLKTLAGLFPVDVIFRCQADELCDPLAVQGVTGSDQDFGIPGLVTAVQCGTVAVANALGSSLVGSPSLLPFLPNLAVGLLGETLRLASAPTWWCGQADVANRVLDRVRSGLQPQWNHAYNSRLTSQGSTPNQGDLSSDTPNYNVIAQEPMTASSTPLGFDSGAGPHAVSMRVFLAAARSGYQVLPGGLVRLAPGSTPYSNADDSLTGGILRDAWVMSPRPVKHASLLAKNKQPPVLRRSAADIPSRVADSLFWFGRFVERSQGNCRLLRPLIKRMHGEDESRDSDSMRFLIRCLALGGQIEPDFAVDEFQARLPDIAARLPTIIVDPTQAGSLISTLSSATTNASRVRDRLSLDCWKLIYQADRMVKDAHQSPPLGLVELEDLVDRLLTNLMAIDGLVSEGMTRSYIWRFLELGRRMERVLALGTMLKLLDEQSFDEEDRTSESKILEALLECADSVMTYRSRYASEISRAATLDLLITDESNPRGLTFQLAAIAKHVGRLPQDEIESLGSPESKVPLELLHGVRMLELSDLVNHESDEDGRLGVLLNDIAEKLPVLSNWINHRYLIHAGFRSQFSNQGGVAPERETP